MRRMPWLLALCAALCGAAAAAAEPEAAAGMALVAGKQVPLPPGTWLPLGTALEGADSEAIETRVLVRIEGEAVAGLVVARATVAPRRSILGAPGDCGRSDLYLAYTVYDTAYDGLCGFLNLVLLSPAVAGPPAWSEAAGALAARGLRPGATWLMVGISARTRAAAVEVRYYFPPPGFATADPAAAADPPAPADPAGWAGSPWSPARIEEHPARAAAIARLAVWSAWAREAVEAGLRGRLDPAAGLPWPWAPEDLAARLVTRRLQALDALAAAGAIDRAAYQAQRRQLEEVAIVPERAETPVWLHALWKTTTYRVAALLDAIGISYLVLGDVVQSGALVAINAVVRPVAVYLHELAWTYSGYGRAAPATLARDFPEIGLDR